MIPRRSSNPTSRHPRTPGRSHLHPRSHSVKLDLKALRICFPLWVGTTLVYHHPCGRPLKPGLAWFTKKWCHREIQTGGDGGRDPEEDARACLDFLLLKVQNGAGIRRVQDRP